MLSQKQIGILGTGSYLPEAVLTNQDLEKLVDTTAEWIVERSGIHERRIAAPDEDCVTMGVPGRPPGPGGLRPGAGAVELHRHGDQHPAYFFPASGIQVQEELGLGGKVAAFDVQAGC